MTKQTEQAFINSNNQQWQEFKDFPGAQILPLAVPVPQGSIHRLKMAAGTVIPVHHHPCDEYVYVLDGIIETAGRQCTAGTFWSTPANTKKWATPSNYRCRNYHNSSGVQWEYLRGKV